MCGIAGVVSRDVQSTDIVPRLWTHLAHRGPDDRGFCAFSSDRLVLSRDWDSSLARSELLLVHTRLSIIDLSDRGWQPMRSSDGRYVVVFNGEIYNYRELRKELEALGRSFDSDSDTEVLIESFSEWGVEAFGKWVGMFAVAILDTESRSLVLARDPFGIKPLLYADSERGFVFGSNVASVLEVLPPPYRVNQAPLFEYLRWGMSDHLDEAMVAGIKHLPGGHYMTVDLDTHQHVMKAYWSLDLNRRLEVSFEEAVDLVRDAFLRSVDLHLRSDVPLGSALSGGIDSSSIVMAMRHIGGAGLDLRTFSYRSGDSKDEGRWIDIVTEAAGASAYSTSPDPSELVSDLESVIRAQGEPFGSTSILAQYRVFRIAQEAGMKVMLDGQGADEMFGGYRTELAARMASLIRDGRFLSAVRFGRSASALSEMSHRRLWSMTGEYLLPQSWQAAARRLVRREFVPAALAVDWWEPEALHTQTRAGWGKGVMRRNLARGLTSGLPKLLRYEDRNSMAFSIESRVPFLTTELVELAVALPEDFLVSDEGVSKRVLREAMRGIVPDAVLDRQDKIGFATPQGHWLGELRPWVDRLLDSDTAATVLPLDLGEVRRLADQAGTDATGRADGLLWRCLNLIAWSEMSGVEY